MTKKLLLIFLMLFCFGFVNGATITSTSGTGIWSDTGSWVGGVVPTINDDVIIATGSTITINSNVSAKSLTINGILIDTGDNTVTSSSSALNVIINGTVDFGSNQSSLFFPSGTVLSINYPTGRIDNTGGGCSNNVAIYIGTVKFAVCVGSGNGNNAVYTFDQLNQLGGTLQPNPTSSAPACEGNSLTFTADKMGAVGDANALNWWWDIKTPGSPSFTKYTDKQSVVSFASAILGTYEAKLTYTTTYGGTFYTSSKTISVVVNSKPLAPTITPSGATTFCQGGSVTLASSAGSSYLWSTGAITSSIAVTTSGNYSVQVTNAQGCQSPASAITAVTVNPKPLAPTITPDGATTFCQGGSVTLASSAGSSYLWSTGATTSSIAVTTSGNYSVQVTNAQGCQSPASAITAVTVNPKPLAPTITPDGSTTFCQGGSVTLASSAGSSYLWSTGATTSSIAVTTSGNYSVQVTNAQGCQSPASAETTVTVKSQLSLPNIVNLLQPTCNILTGSISLSGLPTTTSAVPNWYIQQSGPAIRTYTGGIGPDATTYTISNLAPGVYNFVIEYGDYCPISLNNVEIKAISANIWQGPILGWSKGSAPTSTSTEPIEFASDYQSAGDLGGCSCKVDAGKNVIINSGHTLTIDNAVAVESGGTLTFKNAASLLQTNVGSNINTGNIKYERIAKQLVRSSYVYWSTPVSPQTLGAVSPLTLGDKYMGYNGKDGTWEITNKSGIMMPGKGYIIRAPQNYDSTIPQDYTATFEGTPNNGTIEGETVIANKYYLIGNPYPSALKATDFLDDNPFLLGTLYFWTHNTTYNIFSNYQYISDDYAVYNGTGSTATLAAGPNTEKPSGYIGAGQAFFARTQPVGSPFFATDVESQKIVFNNDMRIGGSNNAQFYKPGKTSKTATTEKNRIWLNLTNTGGAFKQTLVGYIEGATNDYDTRFDGISFNANAYIDFYSINNQRNFTIQGRTLPFTDTDTVPLGYRTTIAGNFTISIDEVDGLFKEQSIYLEDKLTGTINDLRASNYTFTTAIGTFKDRFVLRYANKKLETGDFETLDNDIIVSIKDKVIKVSSSKESIKEVTVFDASGKLLYNKNKIDANELQISSLQSSNQILLVKVSLENDYTVTKKVVF